LFHCINPTKAHAGTEEVFRDCDFFGIDEDSLSTEQIIGIGASNEGASVFKLSVFSSASEVIKDEKDVTRSFVDVLTTLSAKLVKGVSTSGGGEV